MSDASPLPPTLRATLVADGASDQAILVPLLTLLLDQHQDLTHRIVSAGGLTGGLSLLEKLPTAVKRFPCEVIFVHRDAEGQTAAQRETEIRRAVAASGLEVPHICVLPVRMTEAWLLVDESAIRSAVGNPSGKEPLGLPALNKVESVDAKTALFAALTAASGLGANRLRRFYPEQYRHRVAELTSSLAPVRQLPAFRELETSVSGFLARRFS